ncbi:hypothetical protein D5272_03915 [bacterium D16-76]|nr:hypothetical protein [bacterium D16-76]
MRPKLGQIKPAGKPSGHLKNRVETGCTRTRFWIFPMTTKIPADRPGQGPAKAGSRIFVGGRRQHAKIRP